MLKRASISLAAVAVIACGASKPPATIGGDPATDPTPITGATASASSTASDTSAAPTSTASATAAPAGTAPAAPIALAPELPKPPAAPPGGKYPKQSISYKECWQKIGLSGKGDRDFDVIIAACGAATGMLEYTQPSRGELGPSHHGDVFTVKLYAGMCYRFIAAGDSTIGDVDIRIEKMNGALVAIDKTDQPIAIIESDKPWCSTEDIEYRIHLDVDGPGHGHYVFGVWAQPKPK